VPEKTTKADIAVENSLSIISPQISFYDSICQQSFPFRDSFMLYIAKNPTSSQLFQKMIQTCKYFFHKNPILVISCPITFNYNCQDYVDNQWYIWLNENNIILKNITSKIWVTDEADIKGNNYDEHNFDDHNFDFLVIPKIYQCDIKELTILEQNISLNNIIFLASNFKTIFLSYTTITNDNQIVALEKFMQNLPKLINFEYYLNDVPSNLVISSETFPELLKIPHFPNLNKFHLYHVSETIGIENLYAYIRGNKKTNIRIDFDHISEEFKDHLQEIVTEILLTEYRDYIVPMILFPGMNEESKINLFKIWIDDNYKKEMELYSTSSTAAST
jgi:hypothetical protein